MMGIMRNLTVDGRQHRMRFSADVDGAAQIFRFEIANGVKHQLPAIFPPAHDLLARGRRIQLKFLVAVPVWFFSIAGQEIRPARAHVAGHVLHNHGDAV